MAETIGFIGLGAMGLPMAKTLQAAGFGLRVYNRTASKAAPLVERGALLCDSPGEAADGVEVVISMLGDDAALDQATAGDEGILNSLAPGGIHLSMSTIHPDTARRLAALHDLHDSVYLGAPVYGRPEVAEAGQLDLLLSGDATARKRVQPILEVLGKGVYEFGDDPGAASVVKVCGNFLMGAALEAMGEAYTLAEKNGVDRMAFHEFITGTVLAAPAYQIYGKRIAAEEYEPAGFSLPLGLKDMTLAEQIARASLTPLPLVGLLLDRLTAARARDRSHLDWSALALEVSEAAGLDPERFQKGKPGS